MCQSVVADGKEIITVGELAAWIGVAPSELTFNDSDPLRPEEVNCCLCPVAIEYTLDRFKIWHRCDLEGDSMRTFASRT